MAASKIGSLTNAVSKIKGAKGLANILQKTKAATGANTATMVGTVWNTASEAGFEAFEINKSIRQQLAQKAGYNSFEEIQDAELAARIKDKAGAAAAQTY